MSSQTRTDDRRIVWSDLNLDIEDWREGYKEYLEANELDLDPDDEQAIFDWMVETNSEYLKYNGMTAEKFICTWVKSEFIMPKRLTFRATNTYYELMKPSMEKKTKEALKSND